MFYEIIHSDGRIDQMTLGDIPTTAAEEVAKWPAEMSATVVEIRQVAAHRPAPPAPEPLALAPNISPDVKREIFDLHAEAYRQAAPDTTALEARIASLEATIDALKGAV